MTTRLLLAAFAIALLLEGLTPFIAPAAWRRTVQQLLTLRDGQLRFFGLVATVVGLFLLALVL